MRRALFFFKWGREASPPDRNLKNILIIRLDHLGDVLLAIGLPKALKENFSGARVTFLTASWAAPLLEGNPFVDEVLTYDAPWFSKNKYPRKESGPGFFRLIRILRQKKFDLGLSLRGDAREHFLLWRAGVAQRVGAGITGGGFWLTKEISYGEGVHEQRRLLDHLRPFGVHLDSLPGRIYLTADEARQADDALRSAGVRPADRLLGFQCVAGTPAKQWPMGLAADLLKKFGEKFPGFKVVFVGSSNPEASAVCRSLPCGVDLMDKTSLRVLCALMKRFSFFIGPDSGPAHLAALLETPTLFLFSGTNRFEEWKPLSDHALALRHPVSCSPCALSFCNVAGHPCMESIRPDDVLTALEGRLRGNA